MTVSLNYIHMQVDIQKVGTDIHVCQAALQALGHCMYQEQIAW